MSEFKTKEEYEAWKFQRLKEAKENRKVQLQAPIEHAAHSKVGTQIGRAFSDVLTLLLLGGLASVFVFFVLPLVLKWR